jgi:5'(3')-deoxyribonucleotidase
MIAFFDMDNTLVDYQTQLINDLTLISSPGDLIDFNIEYIESRRHMITNQSKWWSNLPKLELGFDILRVCKTLGYDISILTKGPRFKYHAWSEKLEWIEKNIEEGMVDSISITTDKSLLTGDVLVDDWPDYCEKWLKKNLNGICIMPAHDYNENYSHPAVVRYDGSKESYSTVSTVLYQHFKKGKL